MRTARIKFKDSLPLPVEIALVHRYGFRIDGRERDKGFVWFAKDLVPKSKKEGAVSVNDLDEAVKTDLLRRMNSIVDWYMTPELHVKSIRARINNLAMCRTGVEREFVLQWSEANVQENQ